MALMRGSPILSEERFERAGRAAGPSAPFTVQGAVTATGALFALLVVAALVGWMSVPDVVYQDQLGRVTDAQPGDIPLWVLGAALVGFGLVVVTWFKPRIARFTAPLYALAYGTFVGAVSHVYNTSYDGIVTQALFATMSIFTVMLVLYATRVVRVTNRFVLVVSAAMMGILVMYVAAFVVQLFGGDVTFLSDGSPLALGISAFIIVVGALRLAIDFAFVERAAQHGVPRHLEWLAALGLVVTLVWIYFEVLRLLAMLNRRN